MVGIDKYDLLFDLGKRRGFFWPSFEIYGGVSGYLDLGPLGAKLKRRIEDQWLKLFIYQHRFALISSPVVTPERVFEASGHIEHFKDLMVNCTACHRHFKADQAVSDAMPGRTDIAVEAMSPSEIDSFVSENQIRCPECGGQLSHAEYSSTMFKTNIGPYGDVVGYARPEAAQGMFVDFKRVYDASRERLPLGIAQIGTVMRNEISPRQGPIRLREFTIMELELFFDPEDASCKWLERVEDIELPLLTEGERQLGKSDLTCVTTVDAVKRGLVRNEWSAYFMALSVKFASALGVPLEKQRFEEKMSAERSHYSAQTFDHQIQLDRWGWVEIAGHAYRTDFDLSAHMKSSGADLSIFKPYQTPVERKVTVMVPIESALGPILKEKTKSVVEALASMQPDIIKREFQNRGSFEVHGFKILPSHLRFEERTIRETGRRVVPHVVEPSYGAERIVYSTLEYAYTRQKDRVVLKLPLSISPVQVMVLPLMAKDDLDKVALHVAQFLTDAGFDVEYDDAGTIGRRYARADEIGVPLSITIDYKTHDDETVTIRDRDSWKQVRSRWRNMLDPLREFFQSKASFLDLGKPIEVTYE